MQLRRRGRSATATWGTCDTSIALISCHNKERNNIILFSEKDKITTVNDEAIYSKSNKL